MWLAEQYRRIGLKPMGDDGSWFQWFDMMRTRVSVTASRASDRRAGDDAVPRFHPVTASCPPRPSGRCCGSRTRQTPRSMCAGASSRRRCSRRRTTAIRANSYTFASRYADAAINGTLARFARRGAAAILLVASPAVDSAFEVVVVGPQARRRTTWTTPCRVPRTARRASRRRPRWAPAQRRRTSCARRCARRCARQPQVELSIRLERFTTPTVNVIGVVRGTDPGAARRVRGVQLAPGRQRRAHHARGRLGARGRRRQRAR